MTSVPLAPEKPSTRARGRPPGSKNKPKPEPAAFEPLLVRFKTAAKLLNTTTRTIQRWVEDGTLTVVRKAAHRPLITYASIRRYAESAKD